MFSQFFVDFVLFQDLYNGMVKGIGKENAGLDILKVANNINKIKTHRLAATVTAEDDIICHMRLGHPSTTSIKSINLESTVNSELLNKYPICPLAKQTRLMFPTSSFIYESLFSLVHMDLWGAL